MRISKHHYALEVAKVAKDVFFLEPPNSEVTRVSQSKLPNSNISIVRQPGLRGGDLRFHLHGAYRLIAGARMRRLRKILPKLDVIWCFDPNLFPDLRGFRAGRTIFHAVDPLFYPRQLSAARHADLVLCVSEKILQNFRHLPVRSQLIDHGLPECFAKASPRSPRQISDPVRFGYSGNIWRRQVQHEAIRQIIQRHPNVRFVFWGACQPDDGNPVADRLDDQVNSFIKFLQEAANVELRGVVPPEKLAVEMQQMDGFFLCYHSDGVETDNSNSHKILEYLSTGKVVVANPISHYRGRADLVRAAEAATPTAFVEVFNDTLRNLSTHNSSEAQRIRRDYALEHTYPKQLERISQLLLGI